MVPHDSGGGFIIGGASPCGGSPWDVNDAAGAAFEMGRSEDLSGGPSAPSRGCEGSWSGPAVLICSRWRPTKGNQDGRGAAWFLITLKGVIPGSRKPFPSGRLVD